MILLHYFFKLPLCNIKRTLNEIKNDFVTKIWKQIPGIVIMKNLYLNINFILNSLIQITKFNQRNFWNQSDSELSFN